MNELLITTQKNNKYYIESDFYLNIDEIIFFNSETKEIILKLPYRYNKFTVNSKNTLYNTTQESKEEIKAFILNNKPIRKLKENLNEKNNFYIAKKESHYNYNEYKISLYINVKSEKIEIFEGEEFQEEFQEGHFQVYKNYNFKNLYISYKNFEHLFFTNEDIEKMNYSDFRRYEVKKIDDELNNEKKTQFKQLNNYLNRLKELKNKGFSHIGHHYTEEESEAKQTSVFLRSYNTEEKKRRDANIKYLKDIIYNEKKLKELFNKFNININVVNFED